MSEWKDIKSAPKGRPILIIQDDSVCIAKWEDTPHEDRKLISSRDEDGVKRETYETRMVNSGYWNPVTEDVYSPSHWMEVPKGFGFDRVSVKDYRCRRCGFITQDINNSSHECTPTNLPRAPGIYNP